MNNVILTCNAGSTNSKFAAFDSRTLEVQAHATLHGVAEITEWLCSIGTMGIAAIGHRVVHGGREYIHPELVTAEVIHKLKSYIPLAPLHQPSAIQWIEQTQKLYPEIPQIACFDTAFHHTMPELERQMPLPAWYYKQGIQRYGFHGLSYEHIASVLPSHAKNHSLGRVIVAHLGGGASACAMKDLKSMASTMGFSTLEGLMMTTRCGTMDPGAILYLLNELEMKPEELTRLLYLESGLLGVSGVSGNMKDLLKSDTPEAHNAIELYCYLAAKQMASLLPPIEGLDLLVFTGGIGENASVIREKITARLRWVGKFEVLVIPANEEMVIARACKARLCS